MQTEHLRSSAIVRYLAELQFRLGAATSVDAGSSYGEGTKAAENCRTPKVALSRNEEKLLPVLRADGQLVIPTELGDVAFTAPVAYQEKDGKRVPEFGCRKNSSETSCPFFLSVAHSKTAWENCLRE